MLKIAISGICGKMGRNVLASISERTDCEVLCGLDIGEASGCPVPVYKTPADMPEKPDVIIDYSHPNALSALLGWL